MSRTPFSRVRGALAAFVGVASVAYLGYVLWTRREGLGRAFELDWGTLAVLFGLVGASHVQRALEFDFMLKRLKVGERFVDNFLLTGAALLLNYLPFSAGSVTRAIVLRRQYSLRYSSYVSALLIATLMNGEIAALCGLFASLSVTRENSLSLVTLLFATLALGGGLVVSIPTSWAPAGGGAIGERIRNISGGLALIRGDGSGIVALAGLSLLKLALLSLRLWICFHAFGTDLSAPAVVLLGATAVLAALTNLAPGAIGIRELLLGALTGATGISSTIGLAAASLDRAVLLCYTILAGVPGLLSLRRKLRR